MFFEWPKLFIQWRTLICIPNNVKNVIQLFNHPIIAESFVQKVARQNVRIKNEHIFIIKTNQDVSAATRKYFARLQVKQKNSAHISVWENLHDETDMK